MPGTRAPAPSLLASRSVVTIPQPVVEEFAGVGLVAYDDEVFLLEQDSIRRSYQRLKRYLLRHDPPPRNSVSAPIVAGRTPNDRGR